MEPSNKRRTSSVIEDIDLSDKTHCLLCSNDLKIAALGSCGHNNLCYLCSQRLRLIMKDKACPICKQEQEWIYMTSNLKLQVSDVINVIDDFPADRSDSTIKYETEKVKQESTKEREMVCRYRGCRDAGKVFNNFQGLKHHMEKAHERTFCGICIKGRLVFIGEQKFYHKRRIDKHIEEGDVGGDCDVEILPHPWCNFCERYLYNDAALGKHLQENHMTCHLCGDGYKHFFYKDYKGLEQHFDKTHYLCPDKTCKANCYIAFSTPEELTHHTAMIHQGQKVQDGAANSLLLGFSNLEE